MFKELVRVDFWRALAVNGHMHDVARHDKSIEGSKISREAWRVNDGQLWFEVGGRRGGGSQEVDMRGFGARCLRLELMMMLRLVR